MRRARPSSRWLPPAAFTLIELLVVMAIVGVLLSLVVPAVKSVLESSNLAQAGQILVDHVGQARQIASARNRTVEVRLIKLGGASAVGFTGVQLWMAGLPGPAAIPAMQPITKLAVLPGSMAVAEDPAKLSRLLLAAPASGTMPTGGAASGATYCAFQIYPEGRVAPSMALSDCYVSVVPARFAKAATRPPNFVTVQINPLTGAPLAYRP